MPDDRPATEVSPSVSERMRADWNRRAVEDAHYYVAFGARDQDEAAFLATASDAVRAIEAELPRLAHRSGAALEIGCGPGRLMKPLSRHFKAIHGVDISDQMIRIARERLADTSNAHVHIADGATLSQFGDASIDFVYSYAVFQHIPSRDVVLSYMREIRRVLKPGGVFRGQFNGLDAEAVPDTWSGVSFSAAQLRDFCRENGLLLLALEGVRTQYMWTTWLKPAAALASTANTAAPVVRRITNALTGEPLAPASGRYAAASLWVEGLPPAADLNSVDILFDGRPGTPYHIAPPLPGGLQQINAWLPANLRTGLVPVVLRSPDASATSWLRVVPPGPPVPRIVSVTDGINLVQQDRITTGHVKAVLEEIPSPDSLSITIGGQRALNTQHKCTDPLPPRYEINFELPDGISPGPHSLEIVVGRRRLMPHSIVTCCTAYR